MGEGRRAEMKRADEFSLWAGDAERSGLAAESGGRKDVPPRGWRVTCGLNFQAVIAAAADCPPVVLTRLRSSVKPNSGSLWQDAVWHDCWRE